MRHHALLPIIFALTLGACDGAEFRRPQDSGPSRALLAPDPLAVVALAPDTFNIVFETSKGDIEVAVRRAWSPLAVDRLHYLVTNNFFSGVRFHRVIEGYIAQFGLSGYPAVTAAFRSRPLPDEPRMMSNRLGTLSFAHSGPNTRTTQLFFNMRDNPDLDGEGFSPVGRIVRGVELLPQFFSDHGRALVQERIENEGNAYIQRYTRLDSIVRASIR